MAIQSDCELKRRILPSYFGSSLRGHLLQSFGTNCCTSGRSAPANKSRNDSQSRRSNSSSTMILAWNLNFITMKEQFDFRKELE